MSSTAAAAIPFAVLAVWSLLWTVAAAFGIVQARSILVPVGFTVILAAAAATFGALWRMMVGLENPPDTEPNRPKRQ
ncbi:hypothetical protein ABN028_19785 [Actinopolymorpha sp. B17G11]